MKKPTLKGGITRNFLLSYLAILLIPMLFFGASYSNAVDVITQSAASYHLAMLGQAKNSLEDQITETRRMSMQIALNQEINDYMYSLEHEGASPYQIWQIQNTLQDYIAANQNISQIYLCARENHTIISTSYYHSHTTGSTVATINGSNNLVLSPLFHYSLGSIEPVSIKDDKISQTTLMFVRGFPDGAVNHSYGNICIVYDEAQLKKLLSFSNDWTGGFNLILDENSRILAADGNSPERISEALISFEDNQGSFEISLNNEAMLVTYLKSPAYGWTYLSVYPQSQVLAKTIHTRQILLFCMIAASFIGLIAAAIFAMRNARPVRKIVDSLGHVSEKDSRPAYNEYGIIQNAVDHLLAENKDLVIRSDDQKHMAKEAFFHMLLNNRMPDANLITQLSREWDININHCSFIGIQFSFEQFTTEIQTHKKEKKEIPALLFQLFVKEFGSSRCIFSSAEDRHLILLCFLAEQRLALYSDMQSLIQEANRHLALLDPEIRLFLGISNVYTRIQDIGKCSEEAQFSLEYSKLFNLGRPVFYDSIQENVVGCKFTLNDHQHLLNILKSGNAKAAQKVFNDLVQKKIVDQKINVSTGEQLFYATKTVLVEGMDFIDNSKLREQISTLQFVETDVFNAFLMLEEYYIAVTSEIGRKKENRSSILFEEILTYLKREYVDSNISISSVASRYNISEAQLSKLFREVAQVTFASWLEEFRLREAKQLLEDGKHTVVEISRQTGYNSVESFRRAFKRATGVSPSDFQKSLQKNK